MSRVDMKSNPYEAPALSVLGSFYASTQDLPCVWNKTLGDPDYMFHIPAPISNCS
jgi:hypothetical protein